MAAFYGSKLAIQVFIEEKRALVTNEISFEDVIQRDITKSGPVSPFVDVPLLVCDVTIPVCYALTTKTNDTANKQGLTLSGSKQSILGFFNPIPPCVKVEHENPTFCIIYMKQLQKDDDHDANEDQVVSEVSISYFNEKQKVEILTV